MDAEPAVRVVPFLATDEPIIGTTASIADFWSWAFSDVVGNATRGVLAEFIVGLALGVLDHPRRLWDAVDLRYRGHGIEVKSACAVQAWPQRAPSQLRFSISTATPWDAETNEFGIAAVRSAAAYVFAVATIAAPDVRQMLDVAAWSFHVLPLDIVDSFGSQKSIGHGRLQTLREAVAFQDLRAAVDDALAAEGQQSSG